MARRLRYAINTPSREMNMLKTPKTIEIVLSEDTMIMLVRSYCHERLEITHCVCIFNDLLEGSTV